MNFRFSVRFNSVAVTSVATLAVILMVSCAPKTTDSGSVPSAPATLGGAGTTDSGGGTGLQDAQMAKMFEHYIIDPTKELAYTKHIAPIFGNIKSESGNDSGHEAIFNMKNWYIAPVDFEKMSKESLGVSFLSNSTVQIARQTSRSVWINKELYDQQGVNEPGSIEQAETLLHEWVMTAYFIKFMSANDLCKFGPLKSKPEECIRTAKMIEKILPHEPPRELNADDNENIRSVTAFMMQLRTREISTKDLFTFLFRNGFDKRFFNPNQIDQSPNRLKEIKMSSGEVSLAIAGTERAGQLPNLCQGATSTQVKACRLSIEPMTAEFRVGALSVPMKSLRLVLNVEGAPSINFTSSIGEDVTLPASDDGRGGIVYQLMLLEMPGSIRVGDRTHLAVLWFRKDHEGPQSPLNLEAVTLRSAEVVSIDKKRDPVCLVRFPQVKTFTDDQLLIRSKLSKFNIAEEFYSEMPPMGGCMALNVAD